MSKKVITVKCPEISLPEDFRKRKSYDGRPNDRSHNNFSSKDGRKSRVSVPSTNKKPEEEKSTKEELFEYMKSIKEFNADTSDVGKSRRKFEEDKLAQLGALPLKQPKMPFKVKLRVITAEKKREKRRVDELQQSREVVANNLMPKKKKTKK